MQNVVEDLQKIYERKRSKYLQKFKIVTKHLQKMWKRFEMIYKRWNIFKKFAKDKKICKILQKIFKRFAKDVQKICKILNTYKNKLDMLQKWLGIL